MECLLFDDHSESLFHWRERGLSRLTCLHVDAHLDVMEDNFSPQALADLGATASFKTLSRYRDDGILTCANYLYPALRSGLVERLIWIVPPHILPGEPRTVSVLQELSHWVDLPLADYRAFEESEGIVRGTLFGRDFLVCTSQSVAALKLHECPNLVLDIDLDYFIRATDDVAWQTPHELCEQIGPINPTAVTIATSVTGGYTPAWDQYLGPVCREVFGGSPQAHRRETRLLMSGSEDVWGELLERVSPFMRPAVLSRLGRLEEAFREDSSYRPRLLDRVARCLERKRPRDGLSLLGSEPLEERDGVRLAFLLCHQLEDWESTCRFFSRLQSSRGGVGRGEIKLFELAGHAHQQLGRHAESVRILKQAARLAPDLGGINLSLASAYKEAGEKRKAIRALQKAIRWSRTRISSASTLPLARDWFEQLGQPDLARRARLEWRRLLS